MLTGIIGRKVGMTQVFDPDGTVHPATVIKAGPCVVVQAKNARADGYEAVQLGLVEERPAKSRKPLAGHYKKAGVPPTRVRREVKVVAGGDAVECRRSGARVVGVRQRRSCRRDRNGSRQGLSGRRQAAPLRRRRGDARVDVPSRPGLDWRLVVPVARGQGHACRRTDGRRACHHPQPEGAARRSPTTTCSSSKAACRARRAATWSCARRSRRSGSRSRRSRSPRRGRSRAHNDP